MWDLDNATPFPAHAAFQRDEAARAFWCVWVRVSFRLGPEGRLTCDKDQPDLSRAPRVRAMVGDWAEYDADSDLVLPKRHCDVILRGAVHGPRCGAWTQPVSARLAIGVWSKEVLVWPPRPEEATICDLGYSKAYGGPTHPANPVGRGHDDGRLPRLTLPGAMPGDTGQVPAGFGVCGPDWPARAALAGTFDDQWTRRRAPLLPLDYNPLARQQAASDQQIAPPPPGAQIVIENIGGTVAPASPLGFALPQLDFDLSTRFRHQWHRMRPELQTICIDLYENRLSLVFAASLAVPGAHQDVLVDRSYLALTQGQGFTVTPDLLDAFHSLA